MKRIILLSALVSVAFVGCKCNKTAGTCTAEEETVATEEVVVVEEGVAADTVVVEAAEVPAE